MTNLSFLATRAEGDRRAGADEDDATFVIAGATNQIFLLGDDSSQSQLVPLITLDRDVTVAAMLWDKQKRQLLTLSSNNTLAQFYIDFDMKVTSLFKRKISTGPGADMSLLQLVPVLPGLVAMTSGESEIRLLNLEQDSMYSVRFPSDGSGQAHITSVCALESKHMLAASVKEGRIATWSYCGPQTSTDPEDWQQQATMECEGGSVDMSVFTSAGTVAALQPDCAVVMQETYRKRKWTGTASVVQVSPDTVVVETVSGEVSVVKSRGTVKDLDLAYPQLALWNGRQVDLYAVSDGNSSLQDSFESTNPVLGLHSDGILVAQGEKLLFLNYQKHQLHSVTFAGSDGVPVLIDVLGDFCVIVTANNMMKVFRVSSRDLRQIGPTRPLKQAIGEGRVLTSVRVNSRGKKVAFLTKQTHSAKDDTMIWVYDLDTDQVANNDFSEMNQQPVAVYWNTSGAIGNTNGGATNDLEHLLLTCETTSLSSKAGVTIDESMTSATELEGAPTATGANNVWTLFATTTSVVVHHSFALNRDQICLLGCTVPNLYMCAAPTGSLDPKDHRLDVKRLRDFEGMQAEGDGKIRDALMAFSYYATVGNMDEAYRAVKQVKDVSVWHNLAKLCVATRRIDVAEVCLANMGDGLAARTLRESRGEPELDARLGMLSIALGVPEEAERLFRKCKRFDLLTELYVAAGRWDDAERHAEANDRIRIQPVKYRRAQHLERNGNTDQALQCYKEAHCFSAEAPRLLYGFGRLEELRHVIAQSDDKELGKWWAQYLESNGDVEGALNQYKKQKDFFNAVRILASANPPQIDQAIDLMSSSDFRNDPKGQGAAYFVAQYFEQSDVTKALQYYTQARAYRHAIRLAKENDMFGDIVSLSLKCDDKAVALESASYFESRNQFDKAVQLYQKGGDTTRAIDVCIKGGLYDALHQISETLDSAADPETFISMAEHFINSSHFDKAAQMLVFAKAFNEALQLCMDKDVKLTDEMAEAMTLPKSESDDDEAYRISLLKKIAKVAKNQGSWHLACKKYTQAGERVKAMKMLLQSGDTEKVIFFANHSRNAEIYQLAGNYLQNQNWAQDPNIYKNIVTFYTKAKAWEPLAGFYDAAAQVQIDEYRDYDKALLTLKEAQKVLEKSDTSLTKRQLLEQRIEFAETFVNCRRMIKPGEPCPQMVTMCQDLLAKSHRDHPMHEIVETALRVGDVFALLVEYYDKLGQVENAYALIEKMMDAEIELTYFLENTLIEKIFVAMGKDPSVVKTQQQPAAQAYHGGGEDEVDFLDEEVE